MCLIVSRKKNGAVDWAAVELAQTVNKDGYGIVYPAQDGGVGTWKTMQWEDMLKFARMLEERNLEFTLHLRKTTRGQTSKDHCHPFRVKGHELHLFHNGTFRDIPRVSMTESDSRAFARALSTLKRGFHEDEKKMRALEKSIGENRVVLVDNEAKAHILNEELGETSQGVWYSKGYYLDGETSEWTAYRKSGAGYGGRTVSYYNRQSGKWEPKPTKPSKPSRPTAQIIEHMEAQGYRLNEAGTSFIKTGKNGETLHAIQEPRF